MEKKSVVGLFLLLFFMLSAGPASSTLLGSFANDVLWYTRSSDYPDVNIGMLYQLGLTDDDMLNRIDSPAGTVYMFSEPAFVPFERRITSSDIGSTFVVDNGSYVYWQQMVDHLLVDGSSMSVCRNQGAIDVSSSPFAWTFTDSYNGEGVDFKNYSIDSLLISINDLQIKELGPTLEYYWSLSSTISVDGHQSSDPVPEPATLLLFGVGVINFVGLKFGRRKR